MQLDPDMPAQEMRLHMGEMTAQEMRTARAAIRWANSVSRAPSPSPAPVVVEAGAQKIASWLGFAWDGLHEGSVVAKGFPIFTHGQFGWHFQGYKDDLRNLARDILALASLAQGGDGGAK